jgi:hypothetical protein
MLPPPFPPSHRRLIVVIVIIIVLVIFRHEPCKGALLAPLNVVVHRDDQHPVTSSSFPPSIHCRRSSLWHPCNCHHRCRRHRSIRLFDCCVLGGAKRDGRSRGNEKRLSQQLVGRSAVSPDDESTPPRIIVNCGRIGRASSYPPSSSPHVPRLCVRLHTLS